MFENTALQHKQPTTYKQIVEQAISRGAPQAFSQNSRQTPSNKMQTSPLRFKAKKPSLFRELNELNIHSNQHSVKGGTSATEVAMSPGFHSNSLEKTLPNIKVIVNMEEDDFQTSPR